MDGGREKKMGLMFGFGERKGSARDWGTRERRGNRVG
jgi:hypothetical protein